MIDSIIKDIKGTFNSGNMISRIILVNVIIFVILNLLKVFDFNAATNPNSFSQLIISKLSLVSDPIGLLKQFWSPITHMFVHIGFWHILWNMLLLYWFGRIVGDLIGDNRVLPIYIMGGLAGGLMFIIWDQFIPGGTQGVAIAYGASAAVMCMITASAALSPDYIMHLLLIGPVRLKYIALALVFLDLIGTSGQVNTGGHFGHLGGAFFGLFYVYKLQKGTDLSLGIRSIIDSFSKDKKEAPIKKTPRRVFEIHRNFPKAKSKAVKKPRTLDEQQEIDRILDKINKLGYDQLSAEEKEFLYQASKKK